MSSNPKVTRWLKKEYTIPEGDIDWKFINIDYGKWAKYVVKQFRTSIATGTKDMDDDTARDDATGQALRMITRSKIHAMIYHDRQYWRNVPSENRHASLKAALIHDAMPKKRAAKKKGSSSKKKKSPNGAAKKGSSSKRTRCRNGYRRNKKTGKCEKKKK